MQVRPIAVSQPWVIVYTFIDILLANQPPPIIRTLQPVDEKGDEEVAKGAEGDDSVKSKKSPPGIPQPLGSPKGIAIGDWITAPCAGTDPAGAQKAESADEEW